VLIIIGRGPPGFALDGMQDAEPPIHFLGIPSAPRAGLSHPVTREFAQQTEHFPKILPAQRPLLFAKQA